MALTDESGNGMVMPVAPMYSGNNGGGFGGFGGDGWGWIILLLLIAGGAWGNGFGGNGGGGYGVNGLYPWLNQSNQINDGFRDQMINDNVTSIRDGVHSLQTQLCQCCGDTQMALANGFAGVEQGANARQMANMQQMFGLSTQFADCCCENRLGIANLNATIAKEGCADREALNYATRDIIASQNAGTQRILDQICQDKIDAKNEKILELQNALNMATLRESQTAQNAFISQGFANEVDALYNRLNNCPVPTTPVYGRTPIFTCNQNNGCGCGCGNNF